MTGASVDDVASGMGLDTRIADRYLAAGPGYGGSCLPKDTAALLHTSRQFGTQSRIVAAAFDVNRTRPHQMLRKIEFATGVPLHRARVAVLGITFKANTDDLRESPALELIQELVGRGAEVRAFDPQGMDRARPLLPTVKLANDPYEAMKDADGVVIATEWGEFATLDLAQVAETLAQPVLVDLRNLYDPSLVAAAGLRYISVGRPPVEPEGH